MTELNETSGKNHVGEVQVIIITFRTLSRIVSFDEIRTLSALYGLNLLWRPNKVLNFS